MTGGPGRAAPADPSDHPGIVEIGAICTALGARSQQLFERVGGWVTTSSEPRAQRLFAAACHRHAWHAELWDARRPTIPAIDLTTPAAAPAVADPDPHPDDRLAWYVGVLDDLASILDALAARTDPDLDPATVRTVELVAADVAALRARAGALTV